MSEGSPPSSTQTTTRRVDRRILLANVSIFRDLSTEALDRLLEVTSTKRLAAKEVLFRKGDPGTRLYGVLEGRLKVSAAGADGREMVFRYSDPGEVIGEIALLDSNPRSATVMAMDPCELLSLDSRDFRFFLERQPKVGVHLCEVLAARLRHLSELAEDALFLTLPSRLAKKLLALATSYGSETDAGLLIELRLPQQELGELVGTSRESVNKQLRAWVQEGVLQVERGYITILDLDRLEETARFMID